MSFSMLTRRLGMALLLLPLLLSTPAIVAAATIETSLPLDRAWDPSSPTGRWLADIVADPSADRSMTPTFTWYWLLAEGERLDGAELLEIRETSLGTLEREPRRLPLVGTEGSVADTATDAPLWTASYPIEISPPQRLHGRRIQAITVHPFRFEDGAMHALRNADLRLSTTWDSDPEDLLRPLRPDFPLAERVMAQLGDQLLNPDGLPPAQQSDRAVGGGDLPTGVPGIDGAAVEMVIVTVDSFASRCETYADTRTNRGVPTVVRTLEWIAQHYPYGSDRAEMIRTFVQDAYSKWSIRYLLLVGDAAELPPRYAYTEIFDAGVGRTAPTDQYYACLDGTWNADMDSRWAEAADSLEFDPGDETDWMPEISVGRLPASDLAECDILLGKATDYQNAVSDSYQDRILMMGEVLFPTSWIPGENIIDDGAAACESIYVKYTGPEHEVVRLYENYPDFPGSLPLTVDAALDSMANGFNVVLHNGHGQKQSMSVGDGSIDNTMVTQLDNGDDTFLLYMVNCTAAAFDFNCIAEAFLANPNGGAFAVVGSTRETFANISENYMNEFFDRLYNQPDLTLGDVYSGALSAYNHETSEDNGYRWAQSTFTLMSDPSAWLHYGPLGTIYTDLPTTAPLDGTPVTVNVTDGPSSPLEGMRVTLRRNEEDYQVGSTDAAGDVTFDLWAETAGHYLVNVDARDFKPKSAVFDVAVPGGSPLPRIVSIVVDDTSDGTVVGNGNGVAERGETVRLQATIINNGPVAATGVTATLASVSPHLTLLDTSDSYADLDSGISDSGSDPFLALVLADTPDDEIFPFTLTISSNEGIFDEEFFLEAAAPLLALERSLLDDTAGGNGDGVFDDGETVSLSVSLSNWGRGDAVGVQADVEATAGSSLIVNVGSASLGTLSALSGNQGPALFDLTRSGVNPPELRLILSDAYGHADSLVMLLERPVGVPGAPFYEFGDIPSRLIANWEPAAEQDAAGYVVLRADAPEGPYAQVSTGWVTHATYEDSGLGMLTSYWYRVQPLSAAGLTGALSDSSKVTTPLPVRAGWPQTVGQETISSPVVGDFNGDNINEIMVGSDKVYGFTVDGDELADGDADPLTKGPISALGQNFRSALAAADLTPSPGLELVASSWDTGEVFIFEFADGPGGIEASVAPGWPRTVANGSGIWASVSLGDIDGDRRPEIFVSDVGSYLHAWHADGTEVIDGDNNGSTDGVFKYGLGSWPRTTVAFADIDDDLDNEIFVTTASGQLRGYQGDGSDLPGFPVTGLNEVFASPAIGDVDGDGDVEIVVSAENDSLYVFHHDGSRLAGFPIELENNNGSLKAPSPALADVAGDAGLEIFACGVTDSHYMEIGWIDAGGNWLSGWPVIVMDHSQSSPIVGDLDGDGDFEVVLGHEDGQIDAWHHEGSPVDGFPLTTSEFARAVPSLLDIDKNGTLDMVFVGWDKNVYIWEYPTAYDPSMTPWYTFMHDFLRTGNSATLDWVVDAGEGELLPAGRVLRLDENFPNPFNPKTNIRFTVGGDSSQQVALEIFDVRGRRLVSLLRESLDPGIYLRSWDGRDARGGAMPSGIYFARLTVGADSETKKLTLLK